jgi:hypothetical protein
MRCRWCGKEFHAGWRPPYRKACRRCAAGLPASHRAEVIPFPPERIVAVRVRVRGRWVRCEQGSQP